MQVREGSLNGEGLTIAIVASRFNDAVVERLVSGAESALVRHGVDSDDITLYWVPGAFELPLAAKNVAATGVDAIVVLGTIVRGQTPHFDYVASASAEVASVSLETGIPIGFGVLTTDTWEQAVDRAGGKMGNKGREAALAALEVATLFSS